MTLVSVNDFVLRQVKGSGKTFSPDLSFEQIAQHAEKQYKTGFFNPGYRDGVVIVDAAEEMTKYFVCPYVKVDEDTPLKAEIVKRRTKEESYIQIRALKGKPLRAGKVQFILYRHDVLAENDEHSSDIEWELISIHALPEGLDDLPMGPVTMMRNQLALVGGTKAHYSSEEWAQAVHFWQQYAALEPDL